MAIETTVLHYGSSVSVSEAGEGEEWIPLLQFFLHPCTTWFAPIPVNSQAFGTGCTCEMSLVKLVDFRPPQSGKLTTHKI